MRDQNSNQIAENADVASLADIHKFIPESVYENLPEPLNQIVLEFESRERDIVFLSTLGVLSSCLPKVYCVYDRKKYYPNLNLFIIAPPASGKGAMNWAKLLVNPIHDKIMMDSKARIEQFRNSTSTIGIEKPEFQIKFLPGNVSSARVYNHLKNAHDSLLVFESEADSLSNMLKQDWGDFSDVMRKAFHHETLSISRATDDIYFEIKNPKLSMVLSGTPNQIKPLIASKENGLFSRFMFYYFDDVTRWKDVSPNANYIDLEDVFENHSKVVYKLYGKLYFKENPIHVKFTNSQWQRFQNTMSLATDTFIGNEKEEFLSVVKRFGIIAIRIAMILTVLRNNELIDRQTSELECSDEDITKAIDITKVMIEHSLFVFDLFSKDSVFIPMKERILLNQLPTNFSRAVGLRLALNSNIAERTFADVLKRWEKKGIIAKQGHGEYKKLKIN